SRLGERRRRLALDRSEHLRIEDDRLELREGRLAVRQDEARPSWRRSVVLAAPSAADEPAPMRSQRAYAPLAEARDRRRRNRGPDLGTAWPEPHRRTVSHD